MAKHGRLFGGFLLFGAGAVFAAALNFGGSPTGSTPPQPTPPDPGKASLLPDGSLYVPPGEPAVGLFANEVQPNSPLVTPESAHQTGVILSSNMVNTNVLKDVGNQTNGAANQINSVFIFSPAEKKTLNDLEVFTRQILRDTRKLGDLAEEAIPEKLATQLTSKEISSLFNWTNNFSSMDGLPVSHEVMDKLSYQINQMSPAQKKFEIMHESMKDGFNNVFGYAPEFPLGYTDTSVVGKRFTNNFKSEVAATIKSLNKSAGQANASFESPAGIALLGRDRSYKGKLGALKSYTGYVLDATKKDLNRVK